MATALQGCAPIHLISQDKLFFREGAIFQAPYEVHFKPAQRSEAQNQNLRSIPNSFSACSNDSSARTARQSLYIALAGCINAPLWGLRRRSEVPKTRWKSGIIHPDFIKYEIQAGFYFTNTLPFIYLG